MFLNCYVTLPLCGQVALSTVSPLRSGSRLSYGHQWLSRDS